MIIIKRKNSYIKINIKLVLLSVIAKVNLKIKSNVII